jgi:phosphate transport system substrate-binding protein
MLLLASAAGVAQEAAAPIVAADPYVPDKLMSGTLKFTGSRTLGQIAAIWIDSFRFIHPEVKSQFEAEGSETVFSHLGGKEPHIGLVSRSLTPADQQAFVKAHPKSKLVEVTVTHDAVGVIVHPDNPIASLSREQLQTLFGETGGAAELTWGSVGLTGEWAKTKVERLTPDEKSGTRAQFAARVLGADGKFAEVTAEAWHAKIADHVAAHKGAIGLVNFAAAQSNKVRAVPIAIESNSPAIPLSAESVGAGDYPLIRPFSLLVVVGDNGAMDPLTAEFVRYVLSQDGQSDVIKNGFQPLSRAQLLKQYDRLGWNLAK